MGIFGFVSVAMCWALAVLLYRVGATGSVARKLALLLLVEGVILVTGGSIILFLTPAAIASSWYPAFELAEAVVHLLADCVMLVLYPTFLAAALQTKLTRPFATRGVQIGLAVTSVALFFAVVLSDGVIGAVLLFGAIVLLFAFAFGFRDVCWGFIYGYALSTFFMGVTNTPAPAFHDIVYAGGTFLAVPLIAYGILRTQLFDINLRIRWTIKQSTVAAVFVAVFYLVSEGADRLLASEFGDIAGLVASAMVVFFLVPVQRFAERVASAAMPNTENTPEYAMFRKLQVYEAALTEALPDGNISGRERELLNRLRDSLGISTVDADAVEVELQKGLPGVG